MSGVEFLLGNMEAGRRIGGPGPTRDEADAGPAGRFAACLRHDCSAALMTADGDGDVAVVKCIERGDVALAGNAEYMAHAMDEELVDQDLSRCPGAVVGAHGEISSVVLRELVAYDCTAASDGVCRMLERVSARLTHAGAARAVDSLSPFGERVGVRGSQMPQLQRETKTPHPHPLPMGEGAGRVCAGA